MAFYRFCRSLNLSRARLKKEVGNRVGDDLPRELGKYIVSIDLPID